MQGRELGWVELDWIGLGKGWVGIGVVDGMNGGKG